MSSTHQKRRSNALPFLCRTLCIWAICAQTGATLPQAATNSGASPDSTSTELALVPQLSPTNLISSQRPPGLIPSQNPPGLIPSQRPPGLIPSQVPAESISSELVSVAIPSQVPSGIIASQSPPDIIPSQSPTAIISTQEPGLIPSKAPSGLIPSGLIPSGTPQSGIIPSQSGIIPTLIATSAVGTASGAPNVSLTPMPSWSTDEPLRPIPAPTTAPGDPNGHHEIPEPGFSITGPCRGCSPVIEITATGFDDVPPSPIAEHEGPSSPLGPAEPPKATITIGPSPIIVSQEPTGSNFIIDKSTTVTPGQTITLDKTPVVIQTSAGRTEVIVVAPTGTNTIPLTPSNPEPFRQIITDRPLLSPITIGTRTITANPASQYVLDGQTLLPGGPALTVDGTTLSLLPSATAIVVNDVTSTLSQIYGAVFTTTAAPLLTLNNEIYTANRAGYFVLAPGTTLIPGGPAVTISGTTISLVPKGTAAIIQGSTSFIEPVTTVVTLTRGGGNYVGSGNVVTSIIPANPPQSTSKRGAAGTVSVPMSAGTEGWLEGLLLLVMMGFGGLAAWL
ncbi:uncharacterized protein EI97DRAFT_301473 [Westerdykella ornata]|uniref:Uncharacterized protein n=1 Tax=Westerdykella ornata TaxID=318751 RepID=A0A6A6JN61_WESOR|nr:uncharacterized protein EI97DRAFT_301473 [Westerdykella ornata]KAF2277684.1 hypothetical protein EI97DRAFT_301473 [Westerdykella ornata]